MKFSGRAAGAALVLACAAGVCSSARERGRATLPVLLDHNRILVEVQFERKDGSLRKAKAWVDTGNPALVLGGPLAKELGLEWDAQAAKDPDAEVETSAPAGMRFGSLAMPLDGISCKAAPNTVYPFQGVPAEANLPSTVMMRFDVLFDYPGRTMIMAEPGTLKHRGVRMPCLVDPKTGIVQLDVRVGGETHSFALDNGASYTLVQEDITERLGKRFPGWAVHRGAIGCANMWGLKWEPEWPVMRFGEIGIGPIKVSEAGALGLPQGVFEWYSKKTAAPVTGLLGPNILKAFRVGIDFAGGAVFVERKLRDDPFDMDLVGLTLCPVQDGTFEIIGAAAGTSAQSGDRLLSVGKFDVKNHSMGEVVDALRGKPGEKRRLTLQRGGEKIQVEATVIRYL